MPPSSNWTLEHAERTFCNDRRAAGPSPREKLVQLLERLTEPARGAGGDSGVESFLRGIKIVHDDQRRAAPFFEGHRRHGPAFMPFLIRPDETGMRRHFDIFTEE